MSKIEYVDATWNPIVGCQKISEGCRNCYAERQAIRVQAQLAGNMRGPRTTTRKAIDTWTAYSDVLSWNGERSPNCIRSWPSGWNGHTRLIPHVLDKPLHRKKPTTYFVCDMGDLFHCTVNDDMITQVFRIIALCPQHTFLLLTKRPQRMGQRLKHEMFAFFRDPLHGKQPELQELPFPNAYLGVSVEDQKTANERIPELLKIPAAGRFVSIEPMLGWVDLNGYLGCDLCRHPEGDSVCPYDAVAGGYGLRTCNFRGGIHQVILGGESGPGARPMVGKWVQQVRDDCQDAEVPFFFKQWGDYLKRDKNMAHVEAANGYNPREKKGGRVLDGTTHDELIWKS